MVVIVVVFLCDIGAAIDATVTTLVLVVLPGTVVLICANITGDLKEFEFNARVSGAGVQADAGVGVGAGLSESLVESSKAVLATRPLGDGELSSLAVVGGLCNVAPVECIVEPLVGISSEWQGAVKILDGEFVARVDRQSRGTSLILAELELSRSDILARSPFRVLLRVVREVVPTVSGKVIALP